MPRFWGSTRAARMPKLRWMAQISRPFQIVLVAALALAMVVVAWFMVLHRPGSEPTTGGSSPSVASSAGGPSTHPAAKGTASPAGSGRIYHGSAPGVEGLTRDIKRAHEAAAQEARGGTYDETHAGATHASTTPASVGPSAETHASTPSAASKLHASTPSAASKLHASTPSAASKLHASTPSAASRTHASTPSAASKLHASTPSAASKLHASTPSAASKLHASTPSAASRTHASTTSAASTSHAAATLHTHHTTATVHTHHAGATVHTHHSASTAPRSHAQTQASHSAAATAATAALTLHHLTEALHLNTVVKLVEAIDPAIGLKAKVTHAESVLVARMKSDLQPAHSAAIAAELHQGKTVLLLFLDPKAYDDDVTAIGTTEVAYKLRHHVAAHLALANQVNSFGPITRDIQVYQTPTLLIIDPKREVTSVTGLTDEFALEQAIAEAKG